MVTLTVPKIIRRMVITKRCASHQWIISCQESEKNGKMMEQKSNTITIFLQLIQPPPFYPPKCGSGESIFIYIYKYKSKTYVMIVRCLVEAHLWTNMEETKHIPRRFHWEFPPNSPQSWSLEINISRNLRVSKGDAMWGEPTICKH